MAEVVGKKPGLFATRDVSSLLTETHESGHELKRAVSSWQLTAMGVGAIIGTGIFVVIGEGASLAGPAVILSFALAALACVFSALSYAELASSIPVSGSAYTYTYATLGEIVAWIIGWDLILEYGVSVAAVAVGWGGNLNEFLGNAFGYALPDAISKSPSDGGVFQFAICDHHTRHHVAAGPRGSGKRPGELHHGDHQDRRTALLHRRCRNCDQHGQLQAICASRLGRRGERRGCDLLCLHRLRRRIDWQRGRRRTRRRTCHWPLSVR
jgi:hypothetical protein